MDKMLNFTFELFKLRSTTAKWYQHIEGLHQVSKSHLDLRTFRFRLVGSLDRHSLLRREQLESVSNSHEYQFIERRECYRSQASLPDCRTHFAFALEQVTQDLAVVFKSIRAS